MWLVVVTVFVLVPVRVPGVPRVSVTFAESAPPPVMPFPASTLREQLVAVVAVAELPVQLAELPVTLMPQLPVAPVPVVGTMVPPTRVTAAFGIVSVLFVVSEPLSRLV